MAAMGMRVVLTQTQREELDVNIHAHVWSQFGRQGRASASTKSAKDSCLPSINACMVLGGI